MKNIARGYKLGWRKQLPDHRDLIFQVPAHLKSSPLPVAEDLRTFQPPIYDQQSLNSCVGNSVSAVVQFDAIKQKLAFGNMFPSRLFVYWNARVLGGNSDTDSGAVIRDAIKGVATYGACSAAVWPYVLKNVCVKPNSKCFTTATHNDAIVYSSVPQTAFDIKSAIVSGFPVACGISVYDSFESDAAAATGIIPMPAQTESLLGGHAICVVGYNDSKQWFIMRNSWGTGWGDAGYFYLPYAYLLNPNLASDFWVVRSIL